MPSFDIVSKVDLQEVENGVNQAKKEMESRFDFRGSQSELEWDKKQIVYKAKDDYKIGAIKDILQSKLHRRGIDITSLEFSKVEAIGGMFLKQQATVKQGISKETAKEITQAIRNSQLKVQTQINGDKVTVSSKSIDTLQECMSLVRSKSFGLPLQFENMRS